MQRPIQFGGAQLPALHHRYRTIDDLTAPDEPTQDEPAQESWHYWLSDQRYPALQPVAVTSARQHAMDKHGQQHRDPDRWLAILTEELGEAAAELNDLRRLVDKFGADHENTASLRRRHFTNLKAEIAQTAATAIHFLADLEGYPCAFSAPHPEYPTCERGDTKRWWEIR
jgi:NTP pyrophosphatase (non-canonical NTP hydrolase)